VPRKNCEECMRLLKDINLHHKRRLTEFRFTQDSVIIRHKFLSLISKQDIEVGQIVIEYSPLFLDIRPVLFTDLDILYNR
jgi:hypothetical protein